MARGPKRQNGASKAKEDPPSAFSVAQTGKRSKKVEPTDRKSRSSKKVKDSVASGKQLSPNNVNTASKVVKATAKAKTKQKKPSSAAVVDEEKEDDDESNESGDNDMNELEEDGEVPVKNAKKAKVRSTKVKAVDTDQ